MNQDEMCDAVLFRNDPFDDSGDAEAYEPALRNLCCRPKGHSGPHVCHGLRFRMSDVMSGVRCDIRQATLDGGWVCYEGCLLIDPERH